MYHNIFYLCNVHYYMFRHLCVILREFKKFVYLARFRKFLQLKQLKLQLRKIIIKILFGRRWVITVKPVWRYNILCKQRFCVLYIQSAMNMEINVWIYGYYIVIIYIELT